MKPLTLNEVCEYWLYSKIGYPKGVHRKSKSAPIDINGTVAICAARVESTPGYKGVKNALQVWAMSGSNHQPPTVRKFLGQLVERLIEHPIYELECADEPETEVPEYKIAEIAEKLGTSTFTAFHFMEDVGSMQPGVFKFNRRWRIMNFSALRTIFEKSREKVA